MGRRLEPSDADLLRTTRVQPEAFVAFYRRYESRVIGYMRVRVREPELAADLTAEVFAAALEHAGSFDPARAAGETAAGWLFAIAHNTLVSSLRQGRVAHEARLRLGMVTPLVLDDHAIAVVERLHDIDSDVLGRLEALPHEQRAAIMAHVLEGRPYDEIAAELDCSPLVVRKRVSRGLAALRLQLKERP
jgi:RNA polymerase sigma-70 factor (ECF subfamily)